MVVVLEGPALQGSWGWRVARCQREEVWGEGRVGTRGEFTVQGGVLRRCKESLQS